MKLSTVASLIKFLTTSWLKNYISRFSFFFFFFFILPQYLAPVVKVESLIFRENHWCFFIWKTIWKTKITAVLNEHLNQKQVNSKQPNPTGFSALYSNSWMGFELLNNFFHGYVASLSGFLTSNEQWLATFFHFSIRKQGQMPLANSL